MRTTLKRGIGRAGGLNGNGHGALPPLFGPVTRYRQPEPPGRSLTALFLRGLGWLVLVVAVVAAGVGGGIYLYLHETVNAVAAHTRQVKNAQPELTKLPTTSSPAIALVAGYDHRAGYGTNAYAGSNSDTLMLMRADPANNTLSLFSLPRDLHVPIYCHGDTVYTQSRINAAWGICGGNGPAAALDTVEHYTGLKINYFITLDFHAFKQLVNNLHGVYMNVDQRYYNPLHTGWSAINLHPGYQKLDGGQALSYVRYRHTDSDIYRTGRQQLFVEALKSRLRTSLSVFGIPKLIRALKENIEVGRGGGGAPSLHEIEAYAGLAYHLPAGHLIRVSIPPADFQPLLVGGADELTVSQADIDQAVHEFLHPVVQQQQVQLPGSSKPKHKPKQHKLPKSQISVLVLNAGNLPGGAADTTYLLTQQGYATKTLPASVTANAPGVDRKTTVYYDPVQPNAKTAAQQLAPLFGAQTRVTQMTTAVADFAKQASNPLTVVTLGTSFKGKLTLPQKVHHVTQQPPQVSDGVSVAGPALRSVSARADFPLMVPHEVAEGSRVSSEEGVRLFKPLRHQQEVALTFVLPIGNEYWQIEETTWNSAPILANPTGHFTYHHEQFDVYSSGGQLSMVVLRTPQASYWVVNTILDQLSNSTMLEIAKSLAPLGR